MDTFQDEICPNCGQNIFDGDHVDLSDVDFPCGTDTIVYHYTCDCGTRIEEVFERKYFRILKD